MGKAKRTARKPSRVSSKSMRRQTKQRRKSTKKKATRVKQSKTRKSKGKKGPTAWNLHLMKVYKEMKAKDSKVRFGDAMKVAKKSYKKGPSTKSKWSAPSDEWSTVTK